MSAYPGRPSRLPSMRRRILNNTNLLTLRSRRSGFVEFERKQNGAFRTMFRPRNRLLKHLKRQDDSGFSKRTYDKTSTTYRQTSRVWTVFSMFIILFFAQINGTFCSAYYLVLGVFQYYNVPSSNYQCINLINVNIWFKIKYFNLNVVKIWNNI